MKVSLAYSLLVVSTAVMMSASVEAREETFAERKQRIMRKYMRKQVEIAESETVVPVEETEVFDDQLNAENIPDDPNIMREEGINYNQHMQVVQRVNVPRRSSAREAWLAADQEAVAAAEEEAARSERLDPSNPWGQLDSMENPFDSRFDSALRTGTSPFAEVKPEEQDSSRSYNRFDSRTQGGYDSFSTLDRQEERSSYGSQLDSRRDERTQNPFSSTTQFGGSDDRSRSWSSSYTQPPQQGSSFRSSPDSGGLPTFERIPSADRPAFSFSDDDRDNRFTPASPLHERQDNNVYKRPDKKKVDPYDRSTLRNPMDEHKQRRGPALIEH